ncbi:hypothetical protein [Chryseobacterium sp. GP-SGM7]|uniref:hypothetical protein n=1 Tax=Chryseobacterium sp. GP-SGM7 TaxID=3411323 RepID=UPI003B95455F
MKKLFPLLMLIGLLLLSCGSDDDSLQKIDQLFHLYIKDSTGKDLLNPTKVGSFTGLSLNDELAANDNAPVNFNRKMLSDSTYYMEYLAGATRQFVEDSPDGSKIYKSEIEVSLTKKLSETQNAPVVLDKLEIFYRSSPNIFEVSRVLYNSQLVFSKVQDQPNEVTIIK